MKNIYLPFSDLRTLSICAILLCLYNLTTAQANQPKRIEVYSISQNFWDVTPGETLGDIVQQLLPDNPAMRDRLLQDIIKLNPDAFSHSNPDNLKANIRLWLPNNSPGRASQLNKKNYQVQSFSWGQVYRPKRQTHQQQD